MLFHGMVAGIFNKLGKIGVILGFILGNALLTYATNGNTSQIILFREILIASLGLLALPKGVKIDIEDLYGKTKFLPVNSNRALEQNEDTIYKLNNMSEVISEISESYKQVAATVVEEEKTTDFGYNKEIFLEELANRLEGLEGNLLYEDFLNPEEQIIEDIFSTLIANQEIDRDELLEIFASHNNYIIGFEDKDISKNIENDINAIIGLLNYCYKISKINFIWKKKIDESKKTMSNQLDDVSKVISHLAEDISEKTEQREEGNEALKEEIKLVLLQKNIIVRDIDLKKQEKDRYIIKIYIPTCKEEDTNCKIEMIEKILTKTLKEDIKLQKQNCGINKNSENCVLTFGTKDRFNIGLGIAKTQKLGNSVSGDSSIQIKLEDGKYLIAISDGMGSGPNARKESKIALKMLQRLLTSGFDKKTSLDMINHTLSLNAKGDSFATLDIMILDLYKGEMEIIKNGAMPTFIKNKKDVEIIKAMTLPTGILNNIELITFEKEIKDGDVIVLCTDGIVEANETYENKELWVKYLLEDIETDNPQKIADILLQEAIDHNYGKPKDDMTIIVSKINKIEI